MADVLLNETLAFEDSLAVTTIFGVTASDAAAVTDSVNGGFDRLVSLQESLVVADTLSRSVAYARDLSDGPVIDDVIHTWSVPSDGVLQVNFEGIANLDAVLVKRKALPANLPGVPPKTVALPQPPKEILTHNVVNPNPPQRGDT